MKTSTFYSLSRQLLIILCFCLVLAGCSDDEPTPEPTVAPPAAAATPTAAQAESPLNAPDSPLPTATTAAAAAAVEEVNIIPVSAPVDPQTTATTGAATGRIFINNAQGFRPVTNVIVALAAVITGDDGIERAAGYDAANAPRTDIREDGTFVIDNVPPGRYGVILDAVTTSILLKEAENLDNSLVITIEEGEITDLGNLVYGALALPGLIN
ncbi:MAG: hypothetical protein R3E79_52410 [Caldilineaceae bacterium]